MGRFNWRRWGVRAGVRAVKTFGETAAALVGTEMVGLMEVDWAGVASVSATAAVLALLVSLRGLPELEQEDTARQQRRAGT